MPIDWIPVRKRTPKLNEKVLVKNRTNVWTTKWRDALADQSLPCPVVAWSREEVAGLVGDNTVDPYAIEQQLRFRRK